MKGLRLVRLIATLVGLAVILSGMVLLAINFKEKDDILDWYYGSDLVNDDAMAEKYGFVIETGSPILLEQVKMTDFGVSFVKYFNNQDENSRLEGMGLTETYTDTSNDKEVNIREPIAKKDVNIFISMIIIIVGGIIFIFAYMLLDRSSFLNGKVPSGEKSSTGLGARLVIFLSYLTVGVVGLVFFFIEKQSRFVKHHAIQALLYCILMFIAYIAAVLMNMIFSFMFPPIAYLLETAKFTIISFAFGSVISAVIVSIFGRSFKMPFVGQLAENSSYCD